VQVLTRGPDGGNPTLTRQGRRGGAPSRVGALPSLHPARGGLVEAIGAKPFRAQAKRRKASVAGESARSDKARFPSESRADWRRDGFEISCSYLVRPAGLRVSGMPENHKDEG